MKKELSQCPEWPLVYYIGKNWMNAYAEFFSKSGEEPKFDGSDKDLHVHFYTSRKEARERWDNDPDFRVFCKEKILHAKTCSFSQ